MDVRVVLLQPSTLPPLSAEDLPALPKAMQDISLWWAMHNYDVQFLPVEFVTSDAINLNETSITALWNDVFAVLQPQQKTFAIVRGWDEGKLGVGGNPLACVDEWFLSKIRSVKLDPNGDPTPVTDDFLASGLGAHEIGHFWWGHDFTSEDSIMGYGMYKFPNAYLRHEWRNAPSAPIPGVPAIQHIGVPEAPLGPFRVGCPLPPATAPAAPAAPATLAAPDLRTLLARWLAWCRDQLIALRKKILR